ncbi:hypothetical protein DEU56DRAFT_464726 [Suillus clintonianus]|uniref:uncharacterized protein n=1 Tax=Suillus clintonianus TaxID=1904413 RepID=UPI001B87A8E0|nr:uncharacterized protein DEU56DRAFT_464726 [Suillus clintonianus]KAG2130690.1 hypothetical protein DEU56DRAFT_464726 [Suillus clintonianus]
MGDYVVTVLLERLTTVAYVEAASTAALLFDFCITFDSEVRWTWGRKWGIVRIAFVISRYLPIATCVMYLYYTVMSTRGGIPNTERYYAINGAMNTLCAAASDTLLVARTHAFCGWGKRVLIAISLICVAMIAIALTITNVATSKVGNSTSIQGGQYTSTVSIIYGLLMIYQLVLMSLTLHKRFNFYREENTPLIATVYRDGVIYMLCIVLASMVNCVGIAVLPLPYTFIFYRESCTVFLLHASCSIYGQRTNKMSL